jgi:hypothetical protein
MTNPDEKPGDNVQQSEDMGTEISIDELRDIVGGVLEITTTDNQTLRLDLNRGLEEYNHLDGTTRTVKIAKMKRFKQ